MKTLRLLMITGLLLLASVVLVVAQEGGLSSASIQVDGLACPFCAYGLEKHLKKINGVESIEINMKSGHAKGNRIKICLAIDLNISHISGAE